MKKLITLLFLLFSVIIYAQYNIDTGQIAIYSIGENTVIDTVDRPSTYHYKYGIGVVDRYFQVPKEAPEDTIATLLAQMQPGDGLLFERGGEWRTSIVVPTDSLYIGAYGSGVRPIIDNGIVLNGWTALPEESLFYESNWTSGADSWIAQSGTLSANIDIADSSDVLRFICNNISTTHAFRVASAFNSIVGDIRIVFDYYIPSTNSNIDGVAIEIGNNGVYSPFAGSVLDSWNHIDVTFTLSKNITNFLIYVLDGTSVSFQDIGGDDVAYIKNFKLYTTSTEGTNKYVKVGAAHPNNLVLINGNYGTEKTNSNFVAEQNDWFWTNAGSDSLFIYTSDTTLIETAKTKYTITINTKDNVTFRNLNVKKAGWHNFELQNTQNINIDNCLIEQAGGQGINVDGGSTYYTISNSIIKNNGGDGIYLSGYANNGEIHHNVISGNGYGASGDRQAIGLWISKDVNIFNNDISHSPSGENSFALEFTTDVKAYNKNIRFYNNKVKASNVTRILSVAGGDYYIEYNELIGDGGGYGLMTDDVEYNEIHVYAYNNVIDSTTYGIWIYEDGYVPSHISDSSTYILKNNIISNSSIYHIRVGVGADNGVMGQATFDYNLFDDNTGSKFRYGIATYNFAGWQTNTTQDVNSAVGNPLFVGSGDYSLQTGSPAINAGVDVGLTKDILGNPIVGLPDIGAYEKQ